MKLPTCEGAQQGEILSNIVHKHVTRTCESLPRILTDVSLYLRWVSGEGKHHKVAR